MCSTQKEYKHGFLKEKNRWGKVYLTAFHGWGYYKQDRDDLCLVVQKASPYCMSKQGYLEETRDSCSSFPLEEQVIQKEWRIREIIISLSVLDYGMNTWTHVPEWTHCGNENEVSCAHTFPNKTAVTQLPWRSLWCEVVQDKVPNLVPREQGSFWWHKRV